jgi:hypothetical protein
MADMLNMDSAEVNVAEGSSVLEAAVNTVDVPSQILPGFIDED